MTNRLDIIRFIYLFETCTKIILKQMKHEPTYPCFLDITLRQLPLTGDIKNNWNKSLCAVITKSATWNVASETAPTEAAEV